MAPRRISRNGLGWRQGRRQLAPGRPLSLPSVMLCRRPDASLLRLVDVSGNSPTCLPRKKEKKKQKAESRKQKVEAKATFEFAGPFEGKGLKRGVYFFFGFLFYLIYCPQPAFVFFEPGVVNQRWPDPAAAVVGSGGGGLHRIVLRSGNCMVSYIFCTD